MKRTCPVCGVELVEGPLHGQLVDRCPRGHGLYFDHGELEAIVEIAERLLAVVLDEPEIEVATDREPDRALRCPVDGAVMEKLLLGPEVGDRCPTCRGIWLDQGEITALKLAEQHVKANLQLYIRLGQ